MGASSDRFWTLVTHTLVPQPDRQDVSILLACLESVYRAEYQQLAGEAINAIAAANNAHVRLDGSVTDHEHVSQQQQRRQQQQEGGGGDDSGSSGGDGSSLSSSAGGNTDFLRGTSLDPGSEGGERPIGALEAIRDAAVEGAAAGSPGDLPAAAAAAAEAAVAAAQSYGFRVVVGGDGSVDSMDDGDGGGGATGYDSGGNGSGATAAELDAVALRRLLRLALRAGYQPLTIRDVQLADSLNTDYLSQLFIKGSTRRLDGALVQDYVDPSLPAEARPVLLLQRGYGRELQAGRLLLQKLDFLQTLAVGRAGSWAGGAAAALAAVLFGTFEDGGVGEPFFVDPSAAISGVGVGGDVGAGGVGPGAGAGEVVMGGAADGGRVDKVVSEAAEALATVGKAVGGEAAGVTAAAVAATLAVERVVEEGPQRREVEALVEAEEQRHLGGQRTERWQGRGWRGSREEGEGLEEGEAAAAGPHYVEEGGQAAGALSSSSSPVLGSAVAAATVAAAVAEAPAAVTAVAAAGGQAVTVSAVGNCTAPASAAMPTAPAAPRAAAGAAVFGVVPGGAQDASGRGAHCQAAPPAAADGCVRSGEEDVGNAGPCGPRCGCGGASTSAAAAAADVGATAANVGSLSSPLPSSSSSLKSSSKSSASPSSSSYSSLRSLPANGLADGGLAAAAAAGTSITAATGGDGSPPRSEAAAPVLAAADASVSTTAAAAGGSLCTPAAATTTMKTEGRQEELEAAGGAGADGGRALEGDVVDGDRVALGAVEGEDVGPGTSYASVPPPPPGPWANAVSKVYSVLSDWGLVPRTDVIPLTSFNKHFPVWERPGRQPLFICKVSLLDALGGADWLRGGLRGLVDGLLREVQLQEPTFREVLVLYRPAHTRMAAPLEPSSQLERQRSQRRRLQSDSFDEGDFDGGDEAGEGAGRRQGAPARERKRSRGLRSGWLRRLLLGWRKGGEDEPALRRPPIQIRIYRDIPLPTWKVVLPEKLLQFRPLDLLRVDLFALAGLAGLAAQARYDNMLVDVITFGSAAVLLVRIVLGYQRMADRFRSVVNELLAEKALAGQEGALEALAMAAAQQQMRQAALAYVLLLHHSPPQQQLGTEGEGGLESGAEAAVPAMATTARLQELAEWALAHHSGVRVRFHACQALHELQRLGLVVRVGPDSATSADDAGGSSGDSDGEDLGRAGEVGCAPCSVTDGSGDEANLVLLAAAGRGGGGGGSGGLDVLGLGGLLRSLASDSSVVSASSEGTARSSSGSSSSNNSIWRSFKEAAEAGIGKQDARGRISSSGSGVGSSGGVGGMVGDRSGFGGGLDPFKINIRVDMLGGGSRAVGSGSDGTIGVSAGGSSTTNGIISPNRGLRRGSDSSSNSSNSSNNSSSISSNSSSSSSSTDLDGVAAAASGCARSGGDAAFGGDAGAFSGDGRCCCDDPFSGCDGADGCGCADVWWAAVALRDAVPVVEDHWAGLLWRRVGAILRRRDGL